MPAKETVSVEVDQVGVRGRGARTPNPPLASEIMKPMRKRNEFTRQEGGDRLGASSGQARHREPP